MRRLIQRSGQTVLVVAHLPDMEETGGDYPHEITEQSFPMETFTDGKELIIEVWRTFHLPKAIILGDN